MAVTGVASFTMLLLCMLFAPILGATPAGAGQSGPSQAQVTALTQRINDEATRIHRLTEQLDEAHLKVNLASAHLVAVTREHDATVQGMVANRALLVDQALRAYMQGGDTEVTASASADIAVSGEYLQVASGDLQETGDQLAALDVSLRVQEVTLQGAQQANVQATAQLSGLRTSALSVASSEQAQLDSLQSQLQAQAAAAAAASSRLVPTTQGLPVNNGLVSVVQQAVGTIASAASGATPTLVTSEGTVGVEAGGVWLALRRCESSDNYAENTGNGFYGAYQFSQSTWTGLGYPGRPDEEPASMQDQAAIKLQAESGWGQWPACSIALGLL
jgi:hypothetical protein